MKNVIANINHLDSIYGPLRPEFVPFIEEILTKPVETSYLFQKLMDSFERNWFVLLCELNAFKFSQIPEAILYTDEDGRQSYGFNRWDGCFVIWEAAKYDRANGGLTEYLLELINQYIDFTFQYIDNPKRNFTTDYYFCQFIFLLPLDQVTEKHLNFIKKAALERDRSVISGELLDKFFYRVLELKNERLTFYLLDLFFTPINKNNDFKVESLVDSYFLDNFIDRIPNKLFDAWGVKVVDWVIERLKTLSDDHPFQFMKFNITSLEPDNQNSSTSGINFSLVSLSIALLKLEDIQQTRERVLDFLESANHIFIRIGYYLIDIGYPNLQETFWVLDNPLQDNESKLELYRLFNRHCRIFKPEQITTVISWINSIKIERPENTHEEKHEKYLAYQRLEWYMALEPIHYKYEVLVDGYNALKKITEGEVPKHPGYDNYFSIGPGGEYNHVVRISTLPVEKMLNILANPDSWTGYNAWGLQQDVRDYVLNKTQEVLDHLFDFLYLPPSFLYNFVDAFRTLAEDNVKLPWHKVYELLIQYGASRDDLWVIDETGKQDSSAPIGMVGWLVSAVSRNEENDISIDLIHQGLKLLIMLEDKYQPQFEWLNNDPSFDIINSTRGKLYEAMMASSLREVKLANSAAPYWNEQVKNLFTKRITDESLIPEFYWTAGFYTPQISYLDMNWLASSKEKLFISHEKINGEAAFNGYLLFSAQLYTVLFELLEYKYRESIDKLTMSGSTTKKFVEHILIAYLISFKGAENLLNAILDKQYIEQLTYLITAVRNDEQLLTDEKLLYLWSRLLEFGNHIPDLELQRALSETATFISQVKDLNQEALYLFKTAVDRTDHNGRSYGLIKLVLDICVKGDYKAGAEMLQILLSNSSINFAYDDDKVSEILKILYENNLHTEANEIAELTVNRKNFGAVKVYNAFR